MGKTTLAEHYLGAGDTKSIHLKPYPLSQTQREILDKEVNDMFAGNIEEDVSPWPLPLIIVIHQTVHWLQKIECSYCQISFSLTEYRWRIRLTARSHDFFDIEFVKRVLVNWTNTRKQIKGSVFYSTWFLRIHSATIWFIQCTEYLSKIGVLCDHILKFRLVYATSILYAEPFWCNSCC